MPPPTQGQRALAALQQQQRQDNVRPSVGSLAPVADNRGSSRLRQPSLASMDVTDDLVDDEDYGFDKVPVPRTVVTASRVSPAGVTELDAVGSPTHSTRSRSSRQEVAVSPMLNISSSSSPRPPLSSHPKQMLSANDVVRAATALSKAESSAYSLSTSTHQPNRRVFVPTGNDYMNSHSSPPAARHQQQSGLTAIRSVNDYRREAPTSTVPLRSDTMSTSSPKLKALEHSFVSSPRQGPAQQSTTQRRLQGEGVDSRFVSSFQHARQQQPGSLGHFHQQPSKTTQSWSNSPRTLRQPVPRSPPPPSVVPIVQLPAAPPLYTDFSGFRNAGNTCYAASVLSALLRQPLFCSELAAFVNEFGDLTITRKYTMEEEYEEPVPMEDEPLLPAQQQQEGIDADDERTLRAGLFEDQLSPVSNEETKAFQEYFSTPPASQQQNEDEDIRPPAQQQRMVTKTRTVVEKEKGPVCVLHLALHDAARKLERPQGIPAGIGMKKIAEAMAYYDAYDYFFDGEQHDAHEFYVGLVSCLEDEAVAAMKQAEATQRKKKLKMMKRLRSEDGDSFSSALSTAPAQDETEQPSMITAADVWVNKLLRGSMHAVISCRRRGCGMMQHTREPFVNVALPMSLRTSTPPTQATTALALPTTPLDNPDTEALLAASLAPDALDSYKCDKCHQSVLQYHGGCFDAAPPMLVVQWKRFSASFVNGEYSVRKNINPVQVSRRFTVVARPTHLLTENGSALQEAEGADHRVRRTTYELKSVVLHQGATLHAGHYVTVFQGKRQGNVVHENDDDILELGGKLPQQIQKDELTQPANEEVWYCANDTEVTEITLPHLQRATDNSKACYLAIYEAKGSVFEWDASPHSAGDSPDSDDDAMRSWIIQFPPMQDDPPPPPPPPTPTIEPPPVPKMTDVEPSTPLTMELPETLLDFDDNYDYDYDDDERATTEPSTPITTVVQSALPLAAHCTNQDETIVAMCPPEDRDTPPHERCSSDDEVWLLSPTK